ncbi:MAG: outer membrane protein assembly factor BamD [Balneolia bacterium]|nr:outer membrane protein assembly factor BamD [Balneolia bacterium]
MKRTLFPGLILLISVLVLASCGNQNQIRPGDSLEVAFEKAMNFYDRGRFSDAANAFETVISVGRGTEIGQDAQFYLAESYYNGRQLLLAASEYQRYHVFFPRSSRARDAQFMEAFSYYRLSPRYNLDQSDTYRAIELFQLFISRNQSSDRVEEAAGYIDELRTKLARKNFAAAEQYMRLARREARNYRAAAVYFGITIDRFPETEFAEKALANQIRALTLFADNSVPVRQSERYQEAIDTYETYLQLFPRGDNRSLAEEYYDRASSGLRSAQERDRERAERTAADEAAAS